MYHSNNNKYHLKNELFFSPKAMPKNRSDFDDANYVDLSCIRYRI
jgi:hypothetical protein